MIGPALIMLLAVLPAWAESTTVQDLFSLLEKKYGLIDPAADPRVARVQQIFERVQDAADKRGSRMPRLNVLNKPDDPWAITLPDGNILLSIAAITLCYRNVSQTEGDARMAFVIGHELAHLANNDFWDMEVYLAIAGGSRGGSVARQPGGADPAAEAELRQQRAETWRKESEADDLGFLYAAIAGYPVQTLFSHVSKPEENFFFFWNERAYGGQARDALHPPPREREAFLRARLVRLAEGVPLFRFGVRLALVGGCDQAIPLFRHYKRLFPSREVYNNLGVCHLQRAQQELRSKESAPLAYWLPVLFDADTRAEPLLVGVQRGQQAGDHALLANLPDRSGHALEQAVEYLEQSVAADGGYLPARLNLATAYYHQGHLVKARSMLEDAMRIAPKNRDVEGWHALLRHLDGQEQGFGNAGFSLLTRLASREDAPHSLLFNQAVLSKKAGKNARSWWVRLAGRMNRLPHEYAQVVCGATKTACPSLSPAWEKRVPWSLPVQPGLDLDSMDRNKLFSGWQINPLGRLQDKGQGVAYQQGEKQEVLELDGYVAMVVLRGGLPSATGDLRKKLGDPTHIRPLADGELWRYGARWAVLVRGGRVRELWATSAALSVPSLAGSERLLHARWQSKR
ncbi:MAG: tetratricopeptide repeat protein [Magnetococcus sp. XQGC-1]